MNQGDSYQSHLLGSQEMEAGTEMNLSGPVDFSARPIGPCQQFEPRDNLSRSASFFIGLMTNPANAVVDTAAQDGLIGQQALERLKVQLAEVGLKVAWTGRKARAHGVGGAAKVIGIVAIPVGIGGKSGVLEATVVEGEVPLLLPIRMLRQLGAIIDLPALCIHFSSLSRTLPLNVLPSGHVAIEIVDFGEKGFQFEQSAETPFQESDFRNPVGPTPGPSEVMLSNSTSLSKTAHGLDFHRCAAQAPAAFISSSRNQRRESWAAHKFEEGHQALETGAGQVDIGSAPSWIRGIGAIMASSWARGRDLSHVVFRASGRAHRACREAASSQVESSRSEEGGGVRACSRSLDAGFKPMVSMGVMHGLLQQMEDAGADGAPQQVKEEGEAQFFSRKDTQQRSGDAEGCEVSEGGMQQAETQRGSSEATVGGAEGNDGAMDRGDSAAGGCRSEETGSRNESDEGGVGDQRSHDERVRLNGDGHGICRVQGLSRLRDVRVRQEEMGSSEREAAVGSVARGDHESKSECGSNINLQRRGVGRSDGGDIPAVRFSDENQSEEQIIKQDEELNSKAEETWVRLKRPGGVASQVEKMQQQGVFEVSQVFVEIGEGMSQVKVEELTEEDTECLMRIQRSRKQSLEEELEEIEETALPKKLKTKLRAAEKLNREKSAEESFQVDVSEIFSRPRITAEARRQKLRVGGAYDILTGYDLRCNRDLRRMRKALAEEQPELVTCSPPCGPFSPLQRLNFPKMSFARVMNIVGEGLQHVRTSAQVCKRQYEQDRLFLFEHPRPSKAWEEPEMEALKNLPGVHVCHFDMCRYGMRVGKELNKKPTTMITNSPEIAAELQLMCNGGHQHDALMGGYASKAAEYPPALCQAIVRGLRRHLRKQRLQSKPCESEITVLAFDDDVEDLDEADKEDEEEAEEAERGELEIAAPADIEAEVTAEDRVKIKRMHVNLGHPNKASFLRFLRAGRVRQEILRWVAKDFTCSTCESQVLPKAPRPAVVPRCYEPGVAIGLDVFYVPDENNHRQLPVLNLVDLGTNYQMVEILESKEPMHLWQTMWKVWARTFGLPQFISVDEGREFRGGFSRLCAEAGVVVFRAAARAPWQQGRVERHGGLMKAMLEKGREDMPPTSREELGALLHACEAAKNRFSNRSGFSPTQRQIGHWPRMPSSLLSDEAIDPALQSQGHTDEFERTLEMRRVAQDAFMKLSSREAAARALKARPRVQENYKSGDLVYVYRTLRRKKALRHGAAARSSPLKAKWVGPGQVLATEGSVVWINMLGELWRAAIEQVRAATSEEKLGIEIISEECEEMQERLKRSSHRAGYRDVTNEPFPELEGEQQERRDEVEEEGENRGRPRPRLEDAGVGPAIVDGETELEERTERAEEEITTERERAGRQSSHQTVAEPDGEAPGESTPAAAAASSAATPFQPHSTELTEEMAQQMVRSAAEMRRLDGLPEMSFDALRDQVRDVQWRRSFARPYFCEFEVFFQGEEVQEEQEEEPTKDYWVFDSHRNVVQRHHVRWRKALFNPAQTEGCPVPLRALKKGRRTQWKDATGKVEHVEDEWSLFTAKEERIAWWKGITEFKVDAHYLANAEKQATGTKKKRGEGEVFPHEIPAAEWPEWRKQDEEEFKKIVESGALRVLSVEESKQVWERLKAEGKTDRVIPSRMVRRYKPGEGPGAARIKKSRFCIRGDRDPDILSLSRFAPTVTTSNLQVVFQVAANKRFRGRVGDLKSAFTQSKPLVRSGGPLYCRSFHGSLPGLEEGQLAEIILWCYGLVDAPLNWRMTLTDFIQNDLKYKQSSLDPCTYLYFDYDEVTGQEELQGIISVEVDDLLMFGTAKHDEKVQRLQQRFTFGKLKEIDESGVDFNGRRLKKVGEDFLIDMQAFVEERLHTVKLTPERKKQRGEALTEEERSQVRSVCGGLNWIGREGRPDAAASASMFSSLMSTMKIEDVLELNKAVEQLKSDSSLALRIRPIPEDRLRWGVISDASWANARNGKTQAGHLLVSFDKSLLEGQRATTNVLHWRSGKLQRTVNSTLAAETQSLARGVGDLLWMMIVHEELVTANFQVRDWRKYIGRRGYSAFTKFEETEEVKDALALVDAKSLYDLLVNETTGGTDRRNALDVQVLREELAELKGQIRWVEHLEMPADCLTKRLERWLL